MSIAVQRPLSKEQLLAIMGIFVTNTYEALEWSEHDIVRWILRHSLIVEKNNTTCGRCGRTILGHSPNYIKCGGPECGAHLLYAVTTFYQLGLKERIKVTWAKPVIAGSINTKLDPDCIYAFEG